MSASDNQSSTFPQFTVDFQRWREIHDHEGPEDSSEFVPKELDRVAEDWAAVLDRPMTMMGHSTESLEGPQDPMIPVPQRVPQGYTTMTNDPRQLSSEMMPSVLGTQTSFFDSPPNQVVPSITITNNDAQAAMYDSLGPEWFSGCATSTSTASSCNTDSSCSNDSRPALPVVLKPKEISVIQWQPPSSVSDNSTHGESLVVESRRGKKGNRARGHKAGRPLSQDPRQRSQESSRGGHLNSVNQDSPPALDGIYRTLITHRSQDWQQGHIQIAHLFEYDKDRAFRSHLDGFAALSRLHGRDVQRWATRHLSVNMDSLPVSLKLTSANRRKSSRIQRTVREYHCSEALSEYLNTLETLKMNMSHERALKLSEMTIEAIMNTEGDIAELLSSDNVKTFMTSKWQNHQVQTVEVRPVRPGTATRSDTWNAVVTYTLQVIPHTGGKAPES